MRNTVYLEKVYVNSCRGGTKGPREKDSLMNLHTSITPVLFEDGDISRVLVTDKR